MALSMDLLRDGDVKAGVRRERRVEGECIERQPGPSRLETKLMRPTVGIVDQAIQTRHVHPHAGLVTSQVGVLGEVILGKRLVVLRQLDLHGVDAAGGESERVWRGGERRRDGGAPVLKVGSSVLPGKRESFASPIPQAFQIEAPVVMSRGRFEGRGKEGGGGGGPQGVRAARARGAGKRAAPSRSSGRIGRRGSGRFVRPSRSRRSVWSSLSTSTMGKRPDQVWRTNPSRG